MRSMTGYSRVIHKTPWGRGVLEIHSVNRKMLDFNLYLPRELLCFDVEIRKWIAERVHRGQVTVRLSLTQEEGNERQLHKLSQLKARWTTIATSLGFDAAKSIDLSFLLKESEKEQYDANEKSQEAWNQVLREMVNEALEALIQMKDKEGVVLVEDCLKRLSTIEQHVAEVGRRAEHASRLHGQKLVQRVHEVIAGLGGEKGIEEDERLVREVALLAERLDITEEMTRLTSHIQQFREKAKEKHVGRSLDFLIQEMNREVNTMGSKSADSAISHLVIAMKSELEKIREQVQNIE